MASKQLQRADDQRKPRARISRSAKTDEGQAQKRRFSTQEEQEKSRMFFDATAFALNFIKGAQAGSALHDVLEHWDFQDENSWQHFASKN